LPYYFPLYILKTIGVGFGSKIGQGKISLPDVILPGWSILWMR
jgi:hypothetical protein